MDFSTAIESKMKDVNDGSTEPFIIFRDKNGGWHCDYTHNQYGERFDWVEDVKKQDPLALTFCGKDFANGSFPYVYDVVFSYRIRFEFYESARELPILGAEYKKLKALANFIEDSIGAFTPGAIDYLTNLERPLAATSRMCPFNMATGFDDWAYNKDLAMDAIDCIEQAVIERPRLSAEHCLPDSAYANFTGKLIVVKASELKSEYRTADSQLVLCSHGNGARPNAIGTSVFGKELLSGESVCYGRHQIEGVANPQKMPDWAVEKMAIIESKRAMQNKAQVQPKPTLQEKLSKAKEKAALEAAKNSERVNKLKKRKDMEVT